MDDRRVVSGMLRTGGRWRDVPTAYSPATTVYDRFNRWSRRGFWRAMLAALAETGWIAQTAAVDSTYIKAHRCAHGSKRMARPVRKCLLGSSMICLHKRIRPSGEPLAKMESRAS